MENLKKDITHLFDEEKNVLRYYKRLIQVIVKEDAEHVYLMIRLTHYENSIEDVKYQYSTVIKLSHRKHTVEVFNLP